MTSAIVGPDDPRGVPSDMAEDPKEGEAVPKTDTDHEVCARCRLPQWSHDLWTCLPYHMPDFVEEDDMRREVVLRELNQGALAGMQSEVTERAADLVLAALNRYDAWKANEG